MDRHEKSDGALATSGRDYLIAAAKVGTVAATVHLNPAAAIMLGPLLGELIGNILPGQRSDRFAKFAAVLNQRLSAVEDKFLQSQLTNENFTDLVEEGLRQAARSLSDERREHIANLIANSLSQEDIEFIESKHLLRILGEINDIEVIWLKFYHSHLYGDPTELIRKHESVLQFFTPSSDSPKSGNRQSDVAKELLGAFSSVRAS